MKTRVKLSVAAVAAISLSGCTTLFDGHGEDPAVQSAAKKREINAAARNSTAEPIISPTGSYPGGTTSAEWKSISSSGPK